MTHDVVIRGGTVVDGSGAPAFTADVAIDGHTITAVGRVDGAGRREIAADGALVTPGFVDIHTHYDGQATWDRHLSPSSWHGVTTAVMGNCGVGFAPAHTSQHAALVELMEGVEDIPGAVLDEGLDWSWSSFEEYLDVLAALPRDVDLGAQVPHAALRVFVMGERGIGREAATADDIAAMALLVERAVEAGAIGFSTSRTTNHRSSSGELTPSLGAQPDELLAIAEAMGRTGRGVLQGISDFTNVEAEFALFRDMAARSGRPLSLSVVQDPTRPDLWRTRMDWMRDAAAEGLTMRAQVAARAIGVLLSFDASVNPFMLSPAWRSLERLDPAQRHAMLLDPEVRRVLIGGRRADASQSPLEGRLLDRFDIMFPIGDPPVYEPDPATSVAAVAARTGRDPADVAYDVLTERGGMLYLPIGNYVNGTLDAVGEQLAHPVSVAGLSDGGAHMGTVCDASFPTTLLSHWGRDRSRGRLPLELLVHKQTAATARAVELFDRGVVAAGYRADVNVIDFDRLGLARPELRFDLPAGGKRLVQRASGYLHTFVAGRETQRSGEPTGELPGRLVRGRQRAST